jgi:hypothetical protein
MGGCILTALIPVVSKLHHALNQTVFDFLADTRVQPHITFRPIWRIQVRGALYYLLSPPDLFINQGTRQQSISLLRKNTEIPISLFLQISTRKITEQAS